MANGMSGRRRGSRAFTLTEMLAVMAILSMIVVSLFTIFQQGTETWRLSSARTEAYIKARQILEMMAREIKGAVIITAAAGPRVDPPTGGLPKRADFIGMDSAKLENWRTGYQRFSDQLYFVAPVTNSGRQELCMLGYWIKEKLVIRQGEPDEKEYRDVLQRSYRTDSNGEPDRVWKAFDFRDQSFSTDPLEKTWHFVASGVRELDIKYYDYDTQTGTTPRLTEYPVWDSLPSQYGGSTATKDDDNRLPVAVKITIAVADENDVIKPIRLSKIVYLDNASTRYAEAVQ
jgi:prepilin-type N-terminal cleavage/methylation domain-containing protein